MIFQAKTMDFLTIFRSKELGGTAPGGRKAWIIFGSGDPSGFVQLRRANPDTEQKPISIIASFDIPFHLGHWI